MPHQFRVAPTDDDDDCDMSGGGGSLSALRGQSGLGSRLARAAIRKMDLSR